MSARWLSVVLVPLSLFAGASASAQTAPAMHVETPPPPPPVARTYHLHDGFYLRLALGAGYASAGLDAYSGASTDATVSGGGGAFDLMIGGSPAPGLAIGGGFLANSVISPGFSAAGQSHNLDRSMGLVLVGPFIDGFIDPKNGFHVGGMLGAAALDFGTNADHASSTTYKGAGMALWLGYDAWVAADWSLGGMLRFGGARVSTSEGGMTETATSRNISLLFTALYH